MELFCRQTDRQTEEVWQRERHIAAFGADCQNLSGLQRNIKKSIKNKESRIKNELKHQINCNILFLRALAAASHQKCCQIIKHDIRRVFVHVKNGDYNDPLLHNSSLLWDSSRWWVTTVLKRLHHCDLLSSHPSSTVISECVLSLIPLSLHLSSVSACFSLWGPSEETAAYGCVINKRLWPRGAKTRD